MGNPAADAVLVDVSLALAISAGDSSSPRSYSIVNDITATFRHNFRNVQCFNTVDWALGLAAPCGLYGCKNRLAPFPGWMLYEATKPGSICPLS